MSAAELLEGDLFAAAEALRAGDVTSVELTQASLEALRAYGPGLNAVVELWDDEALATAARIDAERQSGAALGPLAGIPLAHKDMFYRAGKLCASGSTVRGDYVPEVAATVIERLDEAGVVDLGRLNMVEFALGLTGHNDITGHPKNPWDRDYITGGSSSGPVASIAARLVFAALGSDTGGSIRVPAACVGITGIKPTYGRVSRAGALPLSHSLDHVGPLARSARDLALLLEVIAGPDPRDPTAVNRAVPPYTALLERPLGGMRLAVGEAPFEIPLSAEVAGLYDRAVERLGAVDVRASRITLPPIEPLNALRRVIMLAEVAARHEDFVAAKRDEYNLYTLARLEPGYEVAATSYLRAVTYRAEALRRFCGAVFADADVLVLPALAEPISRLDAAGAADTAAYVRLVNGMGHFICPFNYLGLPALTLPIGRTQNGLPMAIQLVGPPFAEARLLRLAYQLEGHADFKLGQPPYPSKGSAR
jgi:aspartyl-tRNA(Asn)/glutamyl-tRNA(Gln) amidotransferase subunit A